MQMSKKAIFEAVLKALDPGVLKPVDVTTNSDTFTKVVVLGIENVRDKLYVKLLHEATDAVDMVSVDDIVSIT